MKLKTLIALQSIIEERKIPIDMEEEHYYYSHSKDEFKDILDMDLHHFIRAFKKLNETQDREEAVLIKDDSQIYVKENFVEALTVYQVFQMLQKKLDESDMDIRSLIEDFMIQKRNEH